MKFSSYYMEETYVNDIVFKTGNIVGGDDIKHNIVYNEPNVKTWLLTNVENLNLIAYDGLMPVPVRYVTNMLKVSLGSKGLYLINSYHIDRSNWILLRGIRNIVESNTFIMDDNNRIKVLSKLDKYINNEYVSSMELKIRLIQHVTLEEILKKDKVKMLNYTISKNSSMVIDENEKGLGKIANESDMKTKGYFNMFVKHYSNKPNNIRKFYIAGKEIAIKSELSGISDNERFHIIMTDERGVVKVNKTVCGRLPAKLDLFSEEDMTTVEKLSKGLGTSSTVELKKIEASMMWRKYLVEKDISLHKLHAYVTNLEINETKLKKEEVIGYKETLKFVKDLLPL